MDDPKADSSKFAVITEEAGKQGAGSKGARIIPAIRFEDSLCAVWRSKKHLYGGTNSYLKPLSSGMGFFPLLPAPCPLPLIHHRDHYGQIRRDAMIQIKLRNYGVEGFTLEQAIANFLKFSPG